MYTNTVLNKFNTKPTNVKLNKVAKIIHQFKLWGLKLIIT